jgi:hypothetical protein
MTDPLVTQAAEYYARKLGEFGPTPRGVDWNSQASQELRFQQLLRIAEGADTIAINDYGCGYGALVDALMATGRPFEYGGYDAAPAMIAAARERYQAVPACEWTSVRSQLKARPFTIASGIFNVKGETAADRWWAYVTRTLDDIAAASTAGFACNFLTSYSDADRQRADLFYPDPSEVLRHCLTRFSRKASVLHDYPLYEFSVLVRL